MFEFFACKGGIFNLATSLKIEKIDNGSKPI